MSEMHTGLGVMKVGGRSPCGVMAAAIVAFANLLPVAAAAPSALPSDDDRR